MKTCFPPSFQKNGGEPGSAHSRGQRQILQLVGRLHAQGWRTDPSRAPPGPGDGLWGDHGRWSLLPGRGASPFAAEKTGAERRWPARPGEPVAPRPAHRDRRASPLLPPVLTGYSPGPRPRAEGRGWGWGPRRAGPGEQQRSGPPGPPRPRRGTPAPFPPAPRVATRRSGPQRRPGCPPAAPQRSERSEAPPCPHVATILSCFLT